MERANLTVIATLAMLYHPTIMCQCFTWFTNWDMVHVPPVLVEAAGGIKTPPLAF